MYISLQCNPLYPKQDPLWLKPLNFSTIDQFPTVWLYLVCSPTDPWWFLCMKHHFTCILTWSLCWLLQFQRNSRMANYRGSGLSLLIILKTFGHLSRGNPLTDQRNGKNLISTLELVVTEIYMYKKINVLVQRQA